MKTIIALLLLFFLFSVSESSAQSYSHWLNQETFEYRTFPGCEPKVHLSCEVERKISYSGKHVCWRIINQTDAPLNVEVKIQLVRSCSKSPITFTLKNKRPLLPGPENSLRYMVGESDVRELGEGFYVKADGCNDGLEIKAINILNCTVTPVKQKADATKKEDDSFIYGGQVFHAKDDRDRDKVPDLVDKCPDLPGMKEFFGCPAPDRPTLTAGFMAAKSIYADLALTSSGFSQKGYDQLITATTNVSSPAADQADVSQLGVALFAERFFGRKRNLGIRTGIIYESVSFSVKLDKFFVEYKAKETSGEFFYRRQISSNNAVTETNSMQVASVPLEAVYSGKISKKLNYFIAAGAVVSMPLTGKAKPAASFDYGAIYSFNGTNDAFDPSMDGADWIITEAFVMQHANSAQQADEYFSRHYQAGFDVGNNVAIDKESEFDLKPAVGLIADAGIQYKLATNIYVNAGVQWMLRMFDSKVSENFKLTDNVGDYNSMLNGVDRVETNFVSASLGIVLSLK